MIRIVVDAGHGGSDPGAVYQGRQEKDDTLRLAMAVGRILEDNGVDVVFTRTDDIYETPFQKATEANQAGADFLVSIHRNSSPLPNQYSGVETLVYDDSGIKAEMAENINKELERAGFANLGISERPGLVVLRRTKMPAVLVEVGFINSDEDNRIFDEHFDEIAQAIADGVLETIRGTDAQSESADRDEEANTDDDSAEWGMEDYRGDEEVPYYRVQTGVFRRRENAQEQLYQLQQQGFPAYIINEDGYYKVQVGAFEKLDNAIRMESVLRKNGYSTFLTT